LHDPVRILHTADWHVGKRLGSIDRRPEFEQALDEVIAIGADEKVDLVVVAGDLFDRAIPPLDSISLVLDTLMRLAGTGSRVVAIPGNHDSAGLFELFGPLLEPRGVHLTTRIRRPHEGGVVIIPSRDGTETAQVAVFPFLHEAEVVDFMTGSEEWFKGYADRVRGISRVLCESLDPGSVGILAGHFFIEGAELGGGERRIHIGSQYAATAQAIPPGVHYAALGHVHRPQVIRGAAVPARYSGSLLALDFSERDQPKEVVVVEASPARPAKVRPVRLSAGRRLIRVEDDIQSLQRRAPEFGNAYLDVRVRTSGPVFGIAEKVRSFLPNAVMVQAIYERTDIPIFRTVGERSLTDSYAEYFASPQGHGVPPPEELIAVMRALEEDLSHAPA